MANALSQLRTKDELREVIQKLKGYSQKVRRVQMLLTTEDEGFKATHF